MSGEVVPLIYAIRILNQKLLPGVAAAGVILYNSPIANVVYLQTSMSKEQLLKISGVYRVDESGKGKLIGKVGGF